VKTYYLVRLGEVDEVRFNILYEGQSVSRHELLRLTIAIRAGNSSSLYIQINCIDGNRISLGCHSQLYIDLARVFPWFAPLDVIYG